MKNLIDAFCNNPIDAFFEKFFADLLKRRERRRINIAIEYIQFRLGQVVSDNLDEELHEMASMHDVDLTEWIRIGESINEMNIKAALDWITYYRRKLRELDAAA